MEIDKGTEKKIEELQILEKNLQGLLMQKQAVQVDLNETTNAADETKNAKSEIYRIVGGLMIRVEKEKITKEIDEKKKILGLRIDAIEKQEKLLDGKIEGLRSFINNIVNKEQPRKKQQ